MLAPNPLSRPIAAAFASCQWFQEDVGLRALRFLDTMLQREPSQKVLPRLALRLCCRQLCESAGRCCRACG
jgi:hypothetical protein